MSHRPKLQGEALVIPKAICLHEEDAGMLWKHTDTRLGHVEVRRNRRLVISQVSSIGILPGVLLVVVALDMVWCVHLAECRICRWRTPASYTSSDCDNSSCHGWVLTCQTPISMQPLCLLQVSTFANYEYGMFWYFYLDGTIQLEMKLTGILSTSVTSLADKHLPHGISVAPGVVASNHQHLFCVRVDPAVDDDNGGKGLIVTEVNAEQIPVGPENPHGEVLGCWTAAATVS